MNQRYRDNELSKQTKKRYGVTNRRKGKTGIPAVIMIAATVIIIVYIAHTAGDVNKLHSDNQKLYNDNNQYIGYDISDEDRARGNAEYNQSTFSPGTISDMKTTILKDYGELIDAIVENEVNRVPTTLDNDRLDKAIDEYGDFKETWITKDTTDYTKASEDDRITMANALYSKRIFVLNDKLAEAEFKSSYLDKNSKEYKENQEKIENIKQQVQYMEDDLAIVGTERENNKKNQDGMQK